MSYRFDEPQNVAIKVASTDEMATVGKNAADLLTERQIVGEDPGYDYRSQDMLEQAQQLQKMSQATNTQLIWIASISLLVGGIGIMNIMLVTVTERTREIGIRRSLGAQRSSIVAQFLIESGMLCGMGGIVGIIFGTIGSLVLGKFLFQMTIFPATWVTLAAFGLSVALGVLFGSYPAAKASKLQPVEALRAD